MEDDQNQKYTIKIEIDVHYDDQFLEDIIVTALEGGSNYWIECIKDFKNAKPKDIPTSIWVFNQLKDGNTITIYLENDDRAFLTIRRLKQGVKRYITENKNLIGDIRSLDAGDFDADMADCILQYAIFDEVIYR